MIRVIVGLGNPGPQYAHTRHNAGFWFVDRYAAQSKVTLSFEKRFHGECGSFVIDSRVDISAGDKVFLLKPATYMNRSGQAVAALLQFYKLAPEQVLVVHDELDLLPGQAKLKQGGGHAGHNGLKDIQSALGSADFWRLRLGIGHPRTLSLQQGVADFVLHPPSKSDLIELERTIEIGLQTLPLMLSGNELLAVQALQRSL